MKRSTHLKKVQAKKKPWDVLIIGGGASGLGAAVDAASRGYRTLLLEKMILPKHLIQKHQTRSRWCSLFTKWGYLPSN